MNLRTQLNAVLDLMEHDQSDEAVHHLSGLAEYYLSQIINTSPKWKMSESELSAACTVGKIQAIKMVRNRLEMSLKEAKELVEREVPARGFEFKHHQWS